MNKKQWTARATALIFALGGITAQAAPIVEKTHFLIPGGAGGGWDGTARGVGEALTKSGLLGQATYENMSGGGGGKAIGYLIENAASNHDTLMVNSTPIIIRSLVGRFPHNFPRSHADRRRHRRLRRDCRQSRQPDQKLFRSRRSLQKKPERSRHRRRLGAGQHGSSGAGDGF